MSESPTLVDVQALEQVMPEPVVILDRLGVLVWANPASERLFGYRLAELAGTTVLSLIHPDDLATATAAMRSLQEKLVGTLLEVRLRTASGWRLVEVLGSDCTDVDGVGGQVLCLRDITGRRRWEVLGDDTARFRALVQHVPSVVMLVDGEGLVQSVSAAVTRILGWDQEMLEGRPLAELVVPAHRARLERALDDLVSRCALRDTDTGNGNGNGGGAGIGSETGSGSGSGTGSASRRGTGSRSGTGSGSGTGSRSGTGSGSGTGSWDRAVTSPRFASIEVDLRSFDDPSSVPFELAIVNLLDDPVVGGLVISAHDLSALHHSEAELREAQRRLVDHERLAAVGQFAAAIGHELRRPLWALTLIHHLLREGLALEPGSELAEQLDMAEKETARAVAVADDLLGYVRPHPPILERLALSEVVCEAVSAAQVPSEVAVSLHLREPQVVADRGQLVQMLANIFVNALQAMGGTGKLDIASALHEKEVVITVDDSGPGIDPALAETIFDAFMTTKPDGMGLGLAIVHALAEGHGGRATLVNRAEGGARATLALPVSSPGTVAEPPVPRRAPAEDRLSVVPGRRPPEHRPRPKTA